MGIGGIRDERTLEEIQFVPVQVTGGGHNRHGAGGAPGARQRLPALRAASGHEYRFVVFSAWCRFSFEKAMF